jgi:hypothetical protein
MPNASTEASGKGLGANGLRRSENPIAALVSGSALTLLQRKQLSLMMKLPEFFTALVLFSTCLMAFHLLPILQLAHPPLLQLNMLLV